MIGRGLLVLGLTLMLLGCDPKPHLSIADVPRYPSAVEVDAGDESNASGTERRSIVLETADTFEDVVAFYEQALSGENVDRMERHEPSARMTSFFMYSRGRLISVNVRTFDDHSVTISIRLTES